MSDLWIHATYNKDDDRFDQARAAVTHRLSSITSALLDAESEAGFEARLSLVQDEVDKIITSATYSDPVLFARVQDDFTQRVQGVWEQKQAWHKQASADEWVQSQEMVNTYPGLKESLLFWTLDTNGGDAAVYEAPGYTGGWRWVATGRDDVEGEGDAASQAEAQGKAAEFLSTHSQIAGQIDMFARKTAFNVRKSNLIAQAGTEAEIDAWFEGNVLPEYVELLTPLKPFMVYGPNYKRGVREKIGDAMFTLRQGYEPSRAYQESVLGALVGTVLHGETWNYDGIENVYRKTSSKKIVSSKKTANVDQITEGQWGCPGCDKTMSDNEKVRNIHVRYECPFRGQSPDAAVAPPSFYDADLDRLLSEAAITVADGEVFSQNITRGFYLTALRSQGMVHWAVSDENGEEVEEVESGSEQSIRDALEQARNTIDQVLQDAGGGSEAPGAPAEAPEAAPSDPEAPAVDPAAPEAEESTPETADPAAAPEEAPEVEGTTPPVEQVPEGEDSENPAAATDGLAEEASPESPNDDIAEESPNGDTEEADPVGPDALEEGAPEEIAEGEVPGDADAEDIVDSADATSGGEVTGLDPKSMNVGDRVNMTYTLTDGTVGDVEVTFVREDNDIFFFDGPNGEFGIGERDEDGGTVWVDSEGQHFAFADGDALEEVTGEEVPDEAVVEDVDVDLDAPVGGGEAAPATESPEVPAEGEEATPETPDEEEKDDDEDEDDFEKKFSSILASMTQENPGVNYQKLRSLARRAAKLSSTMGPIS